jgi:hypothetical protein
VARPPSSGGGGVNPRARRPGEAAPGAPLAREARRRGLGPAERSGEGRSFTAPAGMRESVGPSRARTDRRPRSSVGGDAEDQTPSSQSGATRATAENFHVGRERRNRDGRLEDRMLPARGRDGFHEDGHRARLLRRRHVEKDLGPERRVLALAKRKPVRRRLRPGRVGGKHGEVAQDRQRDRPRPRSFGACRRVQRDLNGLPVAQTGSNRQARGPITARRNSCVAAPRQIHHIASRRCGRSGARCLQVFLAGSSGETGGVYCSRGAARLAVADAGETTRAPAGSRIVRRPTGQLRR